MVSCRALAEVISPLERAKSIGAVENSNKPSATNSPSETSSPTASAPAMAPFTPPVACMAPCPTTSVSTLLIGEVLATLGATTPTRKGIKAPAIAFGPNSAVVFLIA